jgi:hypothetical protein
MAYAHEVAGMAKSLSETMNSFQGRMQEISVAVDDYELDKYSNLDSLPRSAQAARKKEKYNGSSK